MGFLSPKAGLPLPEDAHSSLACLRSPGYDLLGSRFGFLGSGCCQESPGDLILVKHNQRDMWVRRFSLSPALCGAWAREILAAGLAISQAIHLPLTQPLPELGEKPGPGGDRGLAGLRVSPSCGEPDLGGESRVLCFFQAWQLPPKSANSSRDLLTLGILLAPVRCPWLVAVLVWVGRRPRVPDGRTCPQQVPRGHTHLLPCRPQVFPTGGWAPRLWSLFNTYSITLQASLGQCDLNH